MLTPGKTKVIGVIPVGKHTKDICRGGSYSGNRGVKNKIIPFPDRITYFKSNSRINRNRKKKTNKEKQQGQDLFHYFHYTPRKMRTVKTDKYGSFDIIWDILEVHSKYGGETCITLVN